MVTLHKRRRKKARLLLQPCFIVASIRGRAFRARSLLTFYVKNLSELFMICMYKHFSTYKVYYVLCCKRRVAAER